MPQKVYFTNIKRDKKINTFVFTPARFTRLEQPYNISEYQYLKHFNGTKNQELLKKKVLI